MDIKNLIIGGLVGLVVLFGGLSLTSERPMPGASAGPDRSDSCESRNGVLQCFERKVLTQSASTTCQFKSPAATSTLIGASIQFTTGSTTEAVELEIAKSASMMATTSLIGTKYSIPAGAQGTVVASTTATGLERTTFAPNNFLVMKISGGGRGSVPVGSCNATFEVN